MKGFKFLQADMRSSRGDEPAWEIGVKRDIPKERRKEIVICKYGYHASPTLWDALQYAPGPVACLVETGRSVEKQDDKWVTASLTVVKAVNVDRELKLFAADCAEHVLHIYEREHPNDDRPRKAVQATRDFANGKIGAAAGDAARDAARAAARAAAGDAARAAAWAAAWDAAWAATWAAARAAARAAAGDAAGDAAWDAEIKWQKRHFDEMFGGIFK